MIIVNPTIIIVNPTMIIVNPTIIILMASGPTTIIVIVPSSYSKDRDPHDAVRWAKSRMLLGYITSMGQGYGGCGVALASVSRVDPSCNRLVSRMQHLFDISSLFSVCAACDRWCAQTGH